MSLLILQLFELIKSHETVINNVCDFFTMIGDKLIGLGFKSVDLYVKRVRKRDMNV